VRRALTIGIAVVSLACVASTAASRSDAATRPTLKLVKRVPLTVRGSSFRARERVRVSTARRQWRVRASLGGSFVVVLNGVDRCNWVRVVAIGDEGSRAILKILPSPACPPASIP
jgi:hypothetical protein